MLILCDFDGTITSKDITNVLIDEYAGTDWRETVLPDYRAGRIGHLQIMQLSYANLRTPEADLVARSRQIPLRPGFEEFVEFCREHGHHLAVVSGGLDFYIRPRLPEDVPFYSYTGSFNREVGNWEVNMPAWPEVDLAAGQDFKVRILEELKAQHPAARPVVFLGDGRNDARAAAAADLVFAVRGTMLAATFAAQGRRFHEFEDFFQVIDVLKVQPADRLGNPAGPAY